MALIKKGLLATWRDWERSKMRTSRRLKSTLVFLERGSSSVSSM